MFSVLIVDDEKIIRLGVKQILVDHCPEVTKITMASNGQEALALFQQQRDPLVILDIRMPVMDGLHFMKAAQELDAETQFIILSGYDSFDYAQQAISYGCRQYLLKPVEHDALLNGVNLCIAAYKEKSTHSARLKHAFEAAHERATLDYMNGVLTPSEENADFGFEYLTQACHMAVFQAAALFFENGTGAYVADCLKELLTEPQKIRIYPLSPAEVFIACCNTLMNEHAFRLLVENTRKELERCLNIPVSCGFCMASADNADTMRCARKALDKLFYVDSGQCFLYDSGAQGAERPIRLSFDVDRLNLPSSYSEYREMLMRLLDELREKQINRSSCILMLRRMHMRFINDLRLHSASHLSDFLPDDDQFERLLEHCRTFCELRECLATVYPAMSASAEDGNGTRKIIKQIQQYIDENYMQPLTLGALSQQFKISASYLCFLFRDEIGTNFTDYLIALRMSMARKLLCNPVHRIYEVASLVGYDDYRHFSKLFKKQFGITPKEFRETADSL